MVKLQESTILQTFEGDFFSLFNDSPPGSSAAPFASNFSPECLPKTFQFHSSDFDPYYFNTLGQLRKVDFKPENARIKNTKDPEKSAGSDAGKDDIANLQKRGRSKENTKVITEKMIALDSPLKKQYERANGCAEILIQEGDKVTTKYCDSRICHVCNNIRMGKRMNLYLKQFMKMEKREFVTVTVPNVPESQLSAMYDEMNKVSRQILDLLRKRKMPINGIRKLETTYNEIRCDFHPHNHLIMDNHGEIYIDEWLKHFPDANIKGQNIRMADAGSLEELFKYTTKIGTYKEEDGVYDIFVRELDVIMQAMVSRRAIQTFGNVKIGSDNVQDLESRYYKNLPIKGYDEETGEVLSHFYKWTGHDWVNTETGIALTGREKGKFNMRFR